MKRSVFDVSTDMLHISGEKTISTISLQKLVYYAFGWYAHLTGQILFEQGFYAMQKGPVVGELLTLHAGERTIDVERLEQARLEIGDTAQEADPYYEQVLEAVWDVYGCCDPWELVDRTHEDSIWQEAWDSRPEGSKRADLRLDEIRDFFIARSDAPSELLRKLPDPTVITLSHEELEVLSTIPTDAYAPAVSKFQALEVA